MANKHLKKYPHHPYGDEHSPWWWYEEPKGITVVVDKQQHAGEFGYFCITWKAIRNALERKDRDG